MREPVLRKPLGGAEELDVLFVLIVAEACAAAQSTSRVCTHRPLVRSHCLSVLSAEPETSVSPRKCRGGDFSNVACECV